MIYDQYHMIRSGDLILVDEKVTAHTNETREKGKREMEKRQKSSPVGTVVYVRPSA